MPHFPPAAGRGVYLGAPDAFGAWNSSVVQDSRDRVGDGQAMVLPPDHFRTVDQGAGQSGVARVSSSGRSSSVSRQRPRYRPIAPKPTKHKLGDSAGSAPSDPPSSSGVSVELGSTASSAGSQDAAGGEGAAAAGGAVMGGGGRKRNRKRNGPEQPRLPPPPRSSRAPAPLHPRLPILPENSGLQPVLPISTGDLCRALKSAEQPQQLQLQSPWEMPPIAVGMCRPMKDGGAPCHVSGREISSTEDVRPQGMGGAGGALRYDRKTVGIGFGALKFNETAGNEWPPRAAAASLLQDGRALPANGVAVGDEPATFMDRAAAASSTPMLQPVFQFPTKAGGYDVGAFDSFQKCGGQEGGSLATKYSRLQQEGMMPPTSYPSATNHVSSASCSGEGEVLSEHDHYRKPDLVTLSLLPDTPSLPKKIASSEPSIRQQLPSSTGNKNAVKVPFLSLRMASDDRWEAEAAKLEGHEELHKLHKLNLFPEEQSRPPYPDEKQENGTKTELRVVDRYRGGSSNVKGLSMDSQRRSALATFVLSESLDDNNRKLPGKAMNGSRDAEHNNKNSRAVVKDFAYMQSQYSADSEPMRLDSAETGVTLWKNPSYEKAYAKRNTEAAGMCLDPLGHPTEFDIFQYQTPDGPLVNAVLLVFLTTFPRP